MISLATQKFIAEVADDAMQFNKLRTDALGKRAPSVGACGNLPSFAWCPALQSHALFLLDIYS